MKRVWSVCVVLGVLSVLVAVGPSVFAQEDGEFVAPTQPTPGEIEPAVESDRPSIEGIVAAIFKTPRPLQLINPLAPKSYGNGEKFVSKDPNDPGKPQGLIVLSLEW